MLDEVEQWCLGPVDVLEEQDQRLYVGDPLHDLARRPRDLLRAALAFERLHQPCRQPEDVRHGLLGAAFAELLERLLERIVVGDARSGLDHFAEGPVGDALAIRQRTPHEHARSLDAVEELACEPALSHAGLAVDREEVRAAVPQTAVERVREELELCLPSDEWRARAEPTYRAVEHVHQPPGSKWPVDALQLERAGVLDDEACCREPVRGRADQDLARTGRALEPRCQVDRLTRRERRLGAVDDDLAGFDPDPGLELEVVDRFAHGEGCSRGSLRVVLVRLRDAERGHDSVARELLDDTAVLRHALRDRLEELVHAASHDLRIDSGDQPCRIDDVDEQHRCQLALHV